MTVLDIDELTMRIREYSARGWRMLPLRPDTRTPCIAQWQIVATTDVDQVLAWCTDHRTTAIGIATGQASNLWVLDVDVKDGHRGDDTLRELCDTYADNLDTYQVVTGTGGAHLYFTWTHGVEIRNSAGKLGDGLDIRGDGGYVVAPPTVNTSTGRAYEVEASSPDDPIAAPGWLTALAEQPCGNSTPLEYNNGSGNSTTNVASGDRPGDLYNAATTWPQILTSDGWTLARTDRDGEEHWTRPGKTPREGTSATIGYKGTDVLKVFTGSVPWLDSDATYDRFGYYAARHHAGDIAAAAKALHAAGYHAPRERPDLADLIAPVTNGDPQPAESAAPEGLQPVPLGDPTWWEGETGAEWLIEPVIPAGRHIVLYAPAKMGKSLLALEIAAAAATGSPTLGRPAQDPISVVYLDFEMTENDLRERLTDMDYGPDADWSRLAYYSLPSIPALDTPEGGAIIGSLAARHEAQLIVIDTMARVVEGEENSADTYRLFDRYTSLPLKKQGVSVLRIDHSGKDLEKGQRGSSEKVGYADLVWQLVVDGAGQATLRATHRRINWVPETVVMRREDDPRLMHRLTLEAPSVPGLADCVRLLDELEVPTDATSRDAAAALRDAGQGRRRKLVVAAQKVRHHEAERAGLDGLIRESGPVDNPVARGGSVAVVPVVPGTSGTTPEPDGNQGPEMPSDLDGNQTGTTGTNEIAHRRGGHPGGSPPTGGTSRAPAGLPGTKDEPVDNQPSKPDPFAPLTDQET